MVLLLTFTVLLGGAYPLLVKALVENAWNAQVSDTAIRDRTGQILASTLDGAPVDAPQYFWGKIVNAKGADCYESHRAYTLECRRLADERLQALKALPNAQVPDDLTQFGIPGDMPRISPEAAAFQVHRIAQARGLSDTTVSSLVETSLHNPTYELGGGLYVNVLELNLRLDGKLK
ncbi:potassium-transporting ATPase subunit C [Asticcacaulis benevestitus]|uniref:potassium-transporting ATPase subunit C n=1 Tax=Asticcacaulis benevestitus TaxID=347481 RepID=UPI0003A2C8C2|nr:potassium-transporting ATPase subunit C [Asticcacaulis benevestitus]